MNNPKKDVRLRVIVAGGGTAGHIYPALAIAAGLKERFDADILYMGARHDQHGGPPRERDLAESAGWPYTGVSAAGLARRSPRIVLDIVKNLRGIFEARKHISRFKPHIVIGTGGFAMAPVLRAAAGMKIPTLLHEQNACPGWANRYLARKVDTVCLTFAESSSFFSAKTYTKVTGLPVRQDIMKIKREDAYAYWGIEGEEKERFTLLVTGGSQGARHLNEALCSCYGELLAAGLRIIHLTGEAHIDVCRQAAENYSQQENLHVLPYLKDMRFALALADMAVGRSGASFLAEIAVCGLPAILIPYPYAANDHQTLNARSFATSGAALMIKNADLNSATLSNTVLELANDKNRLKKMATATKSLAQINATDNILDAVIELCYNQ